ncbi:hypothetical protein BDF22DRAFT_682868 [Syncephalis plumigaleata]|nr:hypothetical protein BDF22DRAFT_682868 [Syncephalis plumigaleata]
MSATSSSSAYETALANANALLKQKDDLETTIREQEALLNEHRVSMHEPLVDREGYPRADVDVYSIRKIRVRIIELRNDLRGCMSHIEAALHQVHAARKASIEENIATTPTATTTAKVDEVASSTLSTVSLSGKPFARVNAVSPDSPAWDAGLRRDDRIIRFGELDQQRYESLTQLGELVNRHEGRTIDIVIERSVSSDDQSQEQSTLQLVPRKDWGGRGMLGCHIVPLES